MLDTLEISKRLKAAGFGDTEAEALTGVLRDTREFDLSRLATKDDLARVEASLRADIEMLRLATKDDLARVEASLRADMEIMRRDLVIRLSSIMGAMLAVAVAAIGVVIRFLH